MSIVGDVRTGLKANLDSIPGVNVSKYALSNPVGGPLIHMWPTAVAYRQAMLEGIDDVTFLIQAVCSVTTDQDPQAKLDRLLDGEGDYSVTAALYSDKTLGGACDHILVSQVANVQISVTVDNTPRLTADWTCTIYL